MTSKDKKRFYLTVSTVLICFVGFSCSPKKTEETNGEVKHITQEQQTTQPDYWGESGPLKKVDVTEDLLVKGEQLYNVQCSICHGSYGEGNGPAAPFLGVKPRNFHEEGFKFRTTGSGELPTDEDLFRTITVGFPGYGMPRYHYMSEEDRWAIVYYIKTFNDNFKDQEQLELVDLGQEPQANEVLIVKGREIYQEAGCYACHGETGKGDGPSSASLKDSQGRPILALDLTRGGIYFKGGDRPRDIMRDFSTGLNGTPMPSYLDAGFSKDQLWALAHFVKSLTRESAEWEVE